MKRGANNAFQPTRSRCALGFPSAFGPTARLNAGVRHAPLAAHSLAMHLTIALEAAAGAFLLGVVATAPAHVQG